MKLQSDPLHYLKGWGIMTKADNIQANVKRVRITEKCLREQRTLQSPMQIRRRLEYMARRSQVSNAGTWLMMLV